MDKEIEEVTYKGKVYENVERPEKFMQYCASCDIGTECLSFQKVIGRECKLSEIWREKEMSKLKKLPVDIQKVRKSLKVGDLIYVYCRLRRWKFRRNRIWRREYFEQWLEAIYLGSRTIMDGRVAFDPEYIEFMPDSWSTVALVKILDNRTNPFYCTFDSLIVKGWMDKEEVKKIPCPFQKPSKGSYQRMDGKYESIADLPREGVSLQERVRLDKQKEEGWDE